MWLVRHCLPSVPSPGSRNGRARRLACHAARGGALLGVALTIGLAVAGCAGPLGQTGAGPSAQVAVAVPAARPDLDNVIYARGGVAPAPAPAVAAAAVAAPAPAAENASGYLLDSGDRLRVVVFGQDGLSNSYVVDAAGNITMPLIGAVAARGTSTPELARSVGARLRNGFIREPHVAIEVESYRPFFILGEVTFPGQYPYVPNMTVETAVAIAGGFTPRAYRRDAKLARSQSGQSYRMAVPPTYPVLPGDTITIDERWF
jgi:polysaccharide biosynthesis/export protein